MTFERLQCPSFSFLEEIWNSMSSRSWSRPAGDQCTLDKVHFSQCSPLFGGNQAEERNQLLRKDLRARK